MRLIAWQGEDMGEESSSVWAHDGKRADGDKGNLAWQSPAILSRIFPLPTYPHIRIPRYVPQKIGKRKSPPIKAGFAC